MSYQPGPTIEQIERRRAIYDLGLRCREWEVGDAEIEDIEKAIDDFEKAQAALRKPGTPGTQWFGRTT